MAFSFLIFLSLPFLAKDSELTVTSPLTELTRSRARTLIVPMIQAGVCLMRLTRLVNIAHSFRVRSSDNDRV
jgi:hypothetical protein